MAGEAEVKFLDGDFRIVRPGAFVRCEQYVKLGNRLLSCSPDAAQAEGLNSARK